MRVSIERVVDDPQVVDEFLNLYRTAFAPLESIAAARQSLTDDEFRAELSEESVLKFVGRDRSDRIVAMCLLANDLSKLPWLSPVFWHQRYPEQYARNAIYYVGAILVSPSVKGGMWFPRLLIETIRYVAARRGVGALDVCRHNAEDVNLPRIVAEVSASLAEVEVEHVDTQSYWAYVYSGLKSKGTCSTPDREDAGADTEIDLRPAATSAAEDQIDLRATSAELEEVAER
jgi:hypothetical protein